MIRSLKTRIAVWYIALSTAILVGFGLIIYLNLSRSLYNEREALIREDIERIRNFAIAHGSGGLDYFLEELDEHFALKLEDEFIQVFSREGASLYISPNLKGRALPFRPELAASGEVRLQVVEALADQHPLLLTTVPVDITGDSYLVAIAASLASAETAERRLLFILLLSIPVAILTAFFGSLLLAGRAIEPVDQITATARQITALNLNQRISLGKADIELERLAEAFNQMIARLEDSFKHIRRFTADASHELRTPLAILKAETQLALDGNLDPEESRQILKSRLEELERMAKIVDDLLVLSRFDSGENVLQLQRVDLSDLIIESCEQMRKQAEAKRLNLTLEEIHPVEVEGDDLRLRQVFRNLLDNAIKYTPEGGQARISLEPHAEAFCRLTISDTGIGIPAPDLPRIFDRFYRVDKARSREPGGSGLGLSIAKSIVEAHRGYIAVESKPDHGTSVTVILPKL